MPSVPNRPVYGRKVRFEKTRDLYQVMKDAPPPVSDYANLVTLEQCQLAKMIPFCFRTKADRLATIHCFFVSNDVLAHVDSNRKNQDK
jgi:hypothetical protein